MVKRRRVRVVASKATRSKVSKRLEKMRRELEIACEKARYKCKFEVRTGAMEVLRSSPCVKRFCDAKFQQLFGEYAYLCKAPWTSSRIPLRGFGPYIVRQSRSGLFCTLAGKQGHIAVFNRRRVLECELNLMEKIYDVAHLSIETMLAVALRNEVCIYNSRGIDLHCIKQMDKVTRMEYLPNHSLLGTSNEDGYVTWLDVSVGEIVAQYNTNRLDSAIMAQNPWNGVLCLGHIDGVVTMWAPNVREPLAKVSCHDAPMTAIHVHPRGTLMATAAIDEFIRIWDTRLLREPLCEIYCYSVPENLAFSQKDMLAYSTTEGVEVMEMCPIQYYRTHVSVVPYGEQIESFCFTPFQDELRIASTNRFSTVQIPGCNEIYYDGLAENSFSVRTQRFREKIPFKHITLAPSDIPDIETPLTLTKSEVDMFHPKELLHIDLTKGYDFIFS